ncbi:spermatogenic leucine zipper protein 1 [Nycticebus coucang]|uniref:spermatogenic leucine zipper protein 1 n=1 Tax=Nycticebus coucang TaxID=9470 RepID=UPI00234D195C|nr:spermatogenic leucine zipper protein 1 [Nycticebus coucang]
MATSDKSDKMPTPSETLNPSTDLPRESLDARIIIALFGIGSFPPSFWGSLPSSNNSSHEVTDHQTEQKVQNLLKGVKDILKNVASSEESSTEAKESCEESSISEDVSELEYKVRGLGQRNKMLLRKLLVSLDPEKEHNAKKEEMILENLNSNHMAQAFARDSINHSEGEKAFKGTQQSNSKAECGFLNMQEENQKFRNNMEQLLQETEHWSQQHTELSELIRSYQKSQEDIKETLEKGGVRSHAQPDNDAAAQRRLEEHVRQLNHDSHSVHMLAALLENECQILQQRIEILKWLQQQQQEGILQEEPIQINYEQRKKYQNPSEAEKIEMYKQSMQKTEHEFLRKGRSHRRLDVCRSKKASNNRFNTQIARCFLGIKRPSSSLR